MVENLAMKLYLDQLEAQARSAGVSDDAIKKAREECEKANNDDAFRDLLMPIFMSAFADMKF